MRPFKSAPILAPVVIAAALLASGPAGAFPFNAAGAKLTAPVDHFSPTVQVRHRGAAVAAGIIGGLIVGGIIASHGPYYDYGYPPYDYYAPYPAYGYVPPYAAGDAAVAYCARRFRSYDPMSMTYLGYDGLRHPCP